MKARAAGRRYVRDRTPRCLGTVPSAVGGEAKRVEDLSKTLSLASDSRV